MDTQNTDTNITQELLDDALSDTSVMSYAAFNIDNNFPREATTTVTANTYASFPILYEPFRTRIHDIVVNAYGEAQGTYGDDSVVMLSADLDANLMTRQRLAFNASDNAKYFGNLGSKGELVIHGGGNINTPSAEIYNSTVRSGAALRLFGSNNETGEGQFILNTANKNSIGPTLAGYNNGILYWSGNKFNLGGRTLNNNYGTLEWSGTSIKVDAGPNKTPAESGTNNWTGISTTDISSSLILCGGINNTNGGSLALFGASYSDTINATNRDVRLDGAFSLRTQSVNKSGNNVRRYYFTGYNNGNLYWSGNNIQFGLSDVCWSSIMHSNVSSVVNICSSTSNKTGANIRLYSNKAHYNNYNGTYTPAGIQGGFELCVTDDTCNDTKQYTYRLAGHNTSELLWTGNKFKLNGGTLTYNNTNGNKTLICDIAFRTSNKLEFSVGTSIYNLIMSGSELYSTNITGLKLSNNLSLFRSASAAALNCEMAGNGTLYLRGASDNKYGAYMHLYGADNGSGKFEIYTAVKNTNNTYSNNCKFVGYNDGKLEWTGDTFNLGGITLTTNSTQLKHSAQYLLYSDENAYGKVFGLTRNDSYLRIQGGNDTNPNPNGAQLRLGGCAYTIGGVTRGGFSLLTANNDGSTGPTLTGYNYGLLKWTGKDIQFGPSDVSWSSITHSNVSSVVNICSSTSNRTGGNLRLYSNEAHYSSNGTYVSAGIQGGFELCVTDDTCIGNKQYAYRLAGLTGNDAGTLLWTGDTLKISNNLSLFRSSSAAALNCEMAGNGTLYLRSASDNKYGAYMRLHGADNGAGKFEIYTAIKNTNNTYSNNCKLTGYNNGTLKWNDGTPGKYNKHIAGKPTYVNILSPRTWTADDNVECQALSNKLYTFENMFTDKEIIINNTPVKCRDAQSNWGEGAKIENYLILDEEFTKYHRLAIIVMNDKESYVNIYYIETDWLKMVIDSNIDRRIMLATNSCNSYAVIIPKYCSYTSLYIPHGENNENSLFKGIFGIK